MHFSSLHTVYFTSFRSPLFSEVFSTESSYMMGFQRYVLLCDLHSGPSHFPLVPFVDAAIAKFMGVGGTHHFEVEVFEALLFCMLFRFMLSECGNFYFC